MAKIRIIDVLGEKALLLPALFHAATIANERAKYVLALLQMAVAHADSPGAEPASLRAEREACGIADPRFDRVIAGSEALGAGVYYIPDAARLLGVLTAALEAMLAAVELAPHSSAIHGRLAERTQHCVAAIPPIDGDVMSGETIAALTSGRPKAGDGLHLVVMDLHKEINRLQMEIAEDEIDGARVYGIADNDRALVRAFMIGIHRTEALKFDHPGLATTAAQTGEKLLIQNDIGETDAHILVTQISGLTATVTYTDVHAQRLQFFQRMLTASGVAWDETRSRQVNGPRRTICFILS